MTFVIAGADIETTGIKQEEGHRIIEIGLSLWATEDGRSFKKIGKTFLKRINPMRAIDKGAENVHGISIAELRDEPEWEEVAPQINKIISRVNLLVCHNVEFDAPFIALELMRAGFDMPKFDTFCTMKEGRGSTAMGKVPSLEELCWSYDVDYDGEAAHAADYDIDRTMECFFKGLELGRFVVPQLELMSEEKVA